MNQSVDNTKDLRELLHQIADQRQKAAELRRQLLEQNVKQLHELQLDAERRARVNLATISELQRQQSVLRQQQLQLEFLHSRLQRQQQMLRDSIMERYGSPIFEGTSAFPTLYTPQIEQDYRSIVKSNQEEIVEKRIRDNTLQFVLGCAKKELPQEGAECSICIECLRDGDEVRRLGCMHVFHAKCVDRWFIHSGMSSLKYSNTHVPILRCPLCKIDITAMYDFN
jgi:hypothetical protein